MTCRWTACVADVAQGKGEGHHRLGVVGRAGHAGVVGRGQAAASAKLSSRAAAAPMAACESPLGAAA